MEVISQSGEHGRLVSMTGIGQAFQESDHRVKAKPDIATRSLPVGKVALISVAAAIAFDQKGIVASRSTIAVIESSVTSGRRHHDFG